MANEEQLALLKQGVNAWNTWRANHPNVPIDLRGAEFDHANLRDVNLAEAKLEGVDFRGAN